MFGATPIEKKNHSPWLFQTHYTNMNVHKHRQKSQFYFDCSQTVAKMRQRKKNFVPHKYRTKKMKFKNHFIFICLEEN